MRSLPARSVLTPVKMVASFTNRCFPERFGNPFFNEASYVCVCVLVFWNGYPRGSSFFWAAGDRPAYRSGKASRFNDKLRTFINRVLEEELEKQWVKGRNGFWQGLVFLRRMAVGRKTMQNRKEYGSGIQKDPTCRIPYFSSMSRNVYSFAWAGRFVATLFGQC